ncbi:phage Gp37/Gp68 family protein [Nodularia sp. NIES-3585]|uniref:phage Gp37/Gp68 family protein n=1 Tax=Nodularia sp. NIES-3585 TaxID=1973477 RepID=UPI000B5CCF58|nr:phage Gp37/Gp68 family protein [Nodularia sp. NIES-3585]GAX38934.1 phage Gp37Gp68 family protein [Nodularia sp. NIES-3585]
MTTKIQWCDEVWNPIVGCSRISTGCQNCYAATAAKSPRLQQFKQYETVNEWDGTVQFVESQLSKPLHWRKPKKIFVCSMADLFHENVPFEWIDQVFAVMHFAKQHTFQVLTKRPQRALEYFTDYLPDVGTWVQIPHLQSSVNLSRVIPLPNVWIGTSTENQAIADRRIPILMQIPAAKRFLSCEPLLEEIDFVQADIFQKLISDDHEWELVNEYIHWVIVGGESGPNSRPCHVEWIQSIVTQCHSSNTPVFVKQLGSNVYLNQQRFKTHDRKGGDIQEFPTQLRIRKFPFFVV